MMLYTEKIPFAKHRKPFDLCLVKSPYPRRLLRTFHLAAILGCGQKIVVRGDLVVFSLDLRNLFAKGLAKLDGDRSIGSVTACALPWMVGCQPRSGIRKGSYGLGTG